MRGTALFVGVGVAALLCGCGSGATAPPAPVESAAPAVLAAPAPTPMGIATPPLEPDPTPTAQPAATAEPTPAPTPPYRNTVRWSTASEVDNFGYDVYRGTSKDGPFERLTRDPIPGAGTTDEPQKYSFVDDKIDPYETYYYYVEAISLAGLRERFTPIIQSKPKLQRPSSR
jgi:hypothetical protein